MRLSAMKPYASPPNQYETVAEALQAARQRHFTVPFSFRNGQLVNELTGNTYESDQVQVEEFHRSEGLTDPSDSAIVYFLRTTSGEQGWLIDAYGADGNGELAAFLFGQSSKTAG
ncbi:MAG: hypothetical protein RMK52_08005 [Chitinophagales bacterium]|nr:hypothetical protein [Chitinophagales bacterium]MDW8394173.1 hypothetical protein [Chitinophagales bacterium]